jgi:D-lactate dehydrogenase (cytochrome)
MLQAPLLRSLQSLLPQGQVFTDRTALLVYEVDAGMDRGQPEAIVFPRAVEDVVRIVQWAAKHNVPLIARGAGTGLSGGAVADRGGVIVEFAKMNRILDVDVWGRSITSEPAVINLRLDEQAKRHGLYFPPDPASQRASTIGGNVAENSGGPHCFKYGVTTNYILGLDVVLADGQAVRVGGRAVDYPEYDFCGLITGSEGTLALITSITARLLRTPPGVRTMLAIFESVEQAADAVSAIIATGLVPATMEMMDQKITRIAEPFAHAGLPLDAGAILIIEVDGYPAGLDAQSDEIEQLLTMQGVREIRVAHTEEERYKIWLARKSVAGAIARLTPAHYTVDITVPRSRLREILNAVDPICEKYSLRVGHLMHAGDGNLHPMILIPDERDAELMSRVHAAGREMVQCSVEMDGSLTGEHGVGIEKREFMTLMHTPAELQAMEDIKSVFDPSHILNPGKVFPANAPISAQRRQANDNSPHIDALFAPKSAEEVAQAFLVLSQTHRQAYISNDPQKTRELMTRITTSAMSGISRYAPEDMYITVGAGTPLAEIQAFFEQEGKYLPLLSPWPDATIGGVIAANINAPLRMRYGAIRDLVLSTTVALADGRIIRTGRPIVKNVAGYDLTKVFIGSCGTLGLLTDVTLKFFAQPRARHTLQIATNTLQQALDCTRLVLPLALTASTLVVCNGENSESMLLYTAEGLREDVEAELEQVQNALKAGDVTIREIDVAGSEVWMQTLAAGTVVRVGVPASDLPTYMQENRELFRDRYIADMSSGCLYARKDNGTEDELRAWIAALRRSALTMQGYAVVMHLAEDIQNIDRKGYRPQALHMMQRLKKRWDPADILHRDENYLDSVL